MQVDLPNILNKEDEFVTLVNRDRPDLQMEDGSLGIEVTRAMEPRKEVAVDMLKEMAVVLVSCTSSSQNNSQQG